MTRYLLDTNHLSAYLDRKGLLERRIDQAIFEGHRFGITLPILCEYRAGICGGTRFKRNAGRLRRALKTLRFWPVNQQTAVEFGDLFEELRRLGHLLPPFDLLIAASARQLGLKLLTADRDFDAIPRLRTENWLA